jgi:hypothetical protein
VGLFDSLGIPRRVRDGVRGTARVVSATAAPDSATTANVKMTLVVQAEGIPPYSTELHTWCRLDRWPNPGETLPVTVDREDPHRLRVEWDEVVPTAERAKAQADRMAEMLGGFGSFGTGEPGPGGPPPEVQTFGGPGMSGVVVNVSGGSLDDPGVVEALRMAEAMTGMDLDGDGRVGTQTPVPPPASAEPPVEDRIARLERLARLREQGALTDEEFAAEKARVLGEPPGPGPVT